MKLCKKERDEDNIPFKSSRLEGTWDVKSIDGVPLSQDISMEMDFDIEGDLRYTYSYDYYGYTYDYTIRGEWEWKDEKSVIRLIIYGDNIDFDLIRLKSNELSWSNYGEVWELEK